MCNLTDKQVQTRCGQRGLQVHIAQPGDASLIDEMQALLIRGDLRPAIGHSMPRFQSCVQAKKSLASFWQAHFVRDLVVEISQNTSCINPFFARVPNFKPAEFQ